MAEWPIAAVLKTAEPVRVPGVRIPLSPPFLLLARQAISQRNSTTIMQRHFQSDFSDRALHGSFLADGDYFEQGIYKSWGDESAKRRELGQVETPREIAKIMVDWIAVKRPAVVLDPAVGPGILLLEAKKKLPGATLVGIEIDIGTIPLAKGNLPKGSEIIPNDYLLCKVDPVPAIISNPPYVKATTYHYGSVEWASIQATLGMPLDALTNVYAMFVLKIWHDLDEQGRAAVIVPAEFLNANYGEEIKTALVSMTKPVGIAVFNPSVNLFNNALTTSAVLFFDKHGAKTNPLWASIVNNLEELAGFAAFLDSGERPSTLRHSISDIVNWDPKEKWINPLLKKSNANRGSICNTSPAFPKKLGDYFRCRRGIATGANDYFCLSQSEINAKNLPIEDLKPCITKSIDAPGIFFIDSDFEALKNAGRKCFLLDPHTDSDATKAYLELGRAAKIHERYLCKMRKPWFKQENRPIADIWVAVFSRDKVGYILNEAKIKNLTCFHGLYIKQPIPGLSILASVFLNSSYSAKSFAEVSRYYGSGLNKLEPKDVEAMPCPEFPILTDSEIRDILCNMRERMLITKFDNGGPQLDDLCRQYLRL